MLKAREWLSQDPEFSRGLNVPWAGGGTDFDHGLLIFESLIRSLKKIVGERREILWHDELTPRDWCPCAREVVLNTGRRKNGHIVTEWALLDYEYAKAHFEELKELRYRQIGDLEFVGKFTKEKATAKGIVLADILE